MYGAIKNQGLLTGNLGILQTINYEPQTTNLQPHMHGANMNPWLLTGNYKLQTTNNLPRRQAGKP